MAPQVLLSLESFTAYTPPTGLSCSLSPLHKQLVNGWNQVKVCKLFFSRLLLSSAQHPGTCWIDKATLKLGRKEQNLALWYFVRKEVQYQVFPMLGVEAGQYTVLLFPSEFQTESQWLCPKSKSHLSKETSEV